STELDLKHANGLSYVLDLHHAEVVARQPQLAFHLFVNTSGDADAAGFGQSLQPRRDIDAVTEQVVVIDHDVAEVDADPDLHAVILRQVEGSFSQVILNLDRGPPGLDGAREFGHQAVAGAAEDAAAVIGDGPRQRSLAGAKRPQGALFVGF